MEKVLRKFGKYFLLDRLAQGGMAEIFRAQVPSVDGEERLIVLKCVQPNYSEDPEFIQMFRSEIRLTKGFNHPNIVQLYDSGEEEGRLFITMELVDGKNLKQFINRVHKRRELMPPEFAAYLCAQAAAGLHYAHTYKDRQSGKLLQIIHRDISPQNLLVSYDGNLKIIDFGIAKAASNAQETKVGIIKGKPSYLSPEQIKGRELDGRSDVFCLGAVLWETLTGKKLFSGENDIASIRMIEEADTSVTKPSQLNSTVPKELDAICLRALKKERDDRYRTAEEFQSALHRFIYSYKKGFDPSEFSKYLRTIFANEIVTEQQAFLSLNEEAKKVLKSSDPNDPTIARAISQGSGEVAAFSGVGVGSSGSFRPIELESRPDLNSEPILLKTPPPGVVLKSGSGSIRSQKKSEKGSRGGLSRLALLLLVGAAAYFYKNELTSLLGMEVEKSANAPSAVSTASKTPAQVSAPAQKMTPIKLVLNPSGGDLRVSVNMQPVVDPSAIYVPFGPVRLEIEKPGFRKFETDLTATNEAEVIVRAELIPETFGTLTIRTTPSAQASIRWNGASWSLSTPIVDFKLPPGHYDAELMNQLLGMRKTISFDVSEGKKTSSDVTLEIIK